MTPPTRHGLMARLLLWFTRNRPARAIDLDGAHYIERYHVTKFGPVTVLLHRYLGGDGDRQMHDHPWALAIGWPLVGGYDERRVLGFEPGGWVATVKRIRPWRPNLITPLTFHRVASVTPGTWTLFVTVRRMKGWGFAVPVTGHRGEPLVVYDQPFDVEHTAKWERSAPTGRVLRRQRGTE